MAAPCDHPGCGGTVTATGFCDTCGLRPLAARPPVPRAGGTGPGPAGRHRAGPERRPDEASPRYTGIPYWPTPEPAERVRRESVIPEEERFCACGRPVGRGRGPQPGLEQGFCPMCQTPFSFRPALTPGDLVADRYLVEGWVGHGGFGWVYLARDRHLDQEVALKGLRNQRDETAQQLADQERRALAGLEHPGIVRIYDAVPHAGAVGAETVYLVMAFVKGVTLAEVVGGRIRPLDGPLWTEHVARIGVEILAALAYLHDKRLLYCDLKPENVMITEDPEGAGGGRVKLVDFGGVQRLGDTRAPLATTPGYSPDDPKPYQPQFDLYMVGRTLRDLAVAAGDRDGDQVGLTSFRRLLDRAVREDPRDRFESAAVMSRQLDGVRRELESLRTRRENPQVSAEFEPVSELLDAGLGAPPTLEYWTAAARDARLDVGLPTPATVAVGLPAPRVDPGDPAAELLSRTSAPDPGQLLGRLDAVREQQPRSAAVEWLACRAHLELGKPDDAAACVERARARQPDRVGWRLPWSSAIVALARGDVPAARDGFDQVYGLLPGELAPRLALACCAELADEHALADRYHESLWRRDRSVTAAAFGLVRTALVQGRRADALRILDEVPKVSRFYDAAQLAAVRVCSGQLPVAADAADGADGLPTAEDLAEAERRLAGLDLDGDSRNRMTAALRETELALVRQAPGRTRPERAVRTELQESLRQVAWRARTVDEYGVLVDLANAVRPRTWW